MEVKSGRVALAFAMCLSFSLTRLGLGESLHHGL
jgi:hypothetical protein